MSQRDRIFEALYAALTRPPCVFGFTADVTDGSPVLQNLSNASGLMVGMPLAGPGVPTGAILASLSPPSLGRKLWQKDPAATDADLQLAATPPVNATASTPGAKLRQGFRTTSARYRWYSEVTMQPALFMRGGIRESYPARPARGLPARVTLDAEAWIYTQAGKDPNAAPWATLNALIEAVELVLKPAPGFEAQTLGGLVSHCWIEGDIDRELGDLTGQAVAVVPIKILTPIVV